MNNGKKGSLNAILPRSKNQSRSFSGTPFAVTEVLQFEEFQSQYETYGNRDWDRLDTKIITRGVIVADQIIFHGLDKSINYMRKPDLFNDYFNHRNYYDHFEKEQFYPEKYGNEYELDEQDLRWAEISLKEIAYHFGSKKALLDDIEILVNFLEKSWFAISICSQNWLSNNLDKNVVQLSCEICEIEDTKPDDLIVICDICRVPVHQQCYGIPLIPQGRWLCRTCSTCSSCSGCAACPWRRGPLKKTTDPAKPWCHLICADFLKTEVRFLSSVFREPIDLSNIPRERWRLRCHICREISGAPVQCSVKSCFLAMHPLCARFASCSIDRNTFSIKCCLHSELKFIPRPNIHDFDNYGKKTLRSINLYRYPIVPEVIFTSIITLQLSRMLPSQIKLDVSRKICRYWSLKRKRNLGSSFVNEFNEEALRLSNPKSSIHMLREKKNLLCTLKLLEKLCLDIREREIKKRQSVRHTSNCFLLIWAPLRNFISFTFHEFLFTLLESSANSDFDSNLVSKFKLDCLMIRNIRSSIGTEIRSGTYGTLKQYEICIKRIVEGIKGTMLTTKALQSIIDCCSRKAAKFHVTTSSDMFFSNFVVDKCLAKFIQED